MSGRIGGSSANTYMNALSFIMRVGAKQMTLKINKLVND